jgi:histone deacetylase complex subunit SAP18
MNRKDATLCEVVTTLRNTAPHVAEYRHPLARFSFRIVYADAGNKGRFVQKDIGMVYSRDILGEPGSLNSTAPRLLLDTEAGQREEKTLDNLKFIPGDFLLIAVLLPKNVTVPQELPIKGSGIASTASANGWRTTAGAAGGAPGKGDSGWNRGYRADGWSWKCWPLERRIKRS